MTLLVVFIKNLLLCESTSEGEKWGVIDISGNNILEIKFDMIYPLFTNQ